MTAPLVHQYSRMEFPRYEFREYPKVVQNASGESVTVQNADEERAIGVGLPAKPDPGALVAQIADLNTQLEAARKEALDARATRVEPARVEREDPMRGRR